LFIADMTTTNPDQTVPWKILKSLAKNGVPHLRQLLADPRRSNLMTLSACGVTLDFSRQRLEKETSDALLKLAADCKVSAKLAAMFSGEKINKTERRSVLHVALRDSYQDSPPWGDEISREVREVLERMLSFAEQLRRGKVIGAAGAPITDIVNIGIGGSDLGPRMATHALEPAEPQTTRIHFISNPDASGLYRLLRGLDPSRTLFIVASKTFSTEESMTLAQSCRRWLLDEGVDQLKTHLHWAAVTAAKEKALAFGVDSQRIFPFWDWVGGRYSIWSSVGLALAIHIGESGFRAFLEGGASMDQHVLHAPPDQNLPLRMALNGIWNINFLNAQSHVIAPYTSRLLYFTPFIQQMDMESQGKRTSVEGGELAYKTGPVVWGGLGIDGQHAYFQLLHQGTQTVACDFIGVRQDDVPLTTVATHQQIVQKNLMAQVQALALGRDFQTTVSMLRDSGHTDEQIKLLAPHRTFPGNVPTNLIWLDRLDAKTLGALIALYEHKVFYQSAIWNISAFDQWGVELGKTMAAYK
jgi:glucose-6-phosphate isomerase